MVSRKQRRLDSLTGLIAEHSSLHIKDAAEKLDVSEMTIRRDIRDNADLFDYLGGHIVPANQLSRRTPYDLCLAADLHEQEKRQACHQCLPFAITQNVIFVDCGTTLSHLVDLIPQETEITVVCNALNIADRVVRKPNMKLILMGGEYHAPTSSFHGLDAESMFSRLGISTGFFSAAGVDARLGATCSHHNETKPKQAAMAVAKRRILVVDSSKFGKVLPARYASADEFDLILTEHGPYEFQEDR